MHAASQLLKTCSCIVRRKERDDRVEQGSEEVQYCRKNIQGRTENKINWGLVQMYRR